METFIKFCGLDVDGVNLAEAFVPSFTECISICSNWNYHVYYKGLSNVMCTVAAFLLNGVPPGNCWAKNGTIFHNSNVNAVGQLTDFE